MTGKCAVCGGEYEHHPACALMVPAETQDRERQHRVEDDDGACGDCVLCSENLSDVCIVAERFRCAWCGHCTRTHAHRIAA